MKPLSLLLLAAGAFAQSGSDQTGSVSGVVTDAITKMPVKKTLVSINAMMTTPGQNQSASAALTDSGGAYTLSNLAPGRYRLRFQQQSYPQALSRAVEIKAGEAASPVNVELIPGASVTGRIVDEEGDPIRNCNLEVHHANNPQQYAQMTGTTSSNEDGEYRAFGLAPGKYILSVHCNQTPFQARPFSAGPDAPASKAYPDQYYPLTTDIHSAQAVELTAGIEKSGIDFQMTPTAVSSIHGALSWQGADWHGRSVNLQLSSLESHRPAGAARLDEEKGTFEFQRVFPGSYAIVALSAGGEDRIGVWQQVDVTDQPLAVTLELRHASEIRGTVEIENGGNSTKPVPLSQCQIMLTAGIQGGPPGSQIHANDDGTFTLRGVMPGPFRLFAVGPAVFLKSAWLGSTDITHTAIDFSGGTGGTLRIVMSTNTATIRGSAPAGEAIFLQRIEDTPFWGNRDMSSDQNGQFAFEGLAPGTYRIAIVEGRGSIPDGGSREITVREGETAMIDLKSEHVQF